MLDQDEFELLSRIEAGDSVFRLSGSTPEAQLVFHGIVVRLLQLRDRGLVRLPAGRVGTNSKGVVIMVGPCDLTEVGGRALRRDRELGPRPPPTRGPEQPE